MKWRCQATKITNQKPTPKHSCTPWGPNVAWRNDSMNRWMDGWSASSTTIHSFPKRVHFHNYHCECVCMLLRKDELHNRAIIVIRDTFNWYEWNQFFHSLPIKYYSMILQCHWFNWLIGSVIKLTTKKRNTHSNRDPIHSISIAGDVVIVVVVCQWQYQTDTSVYDIQFA